ncbi:hypothetical protein QFW77_08730 [Luteimonas sp. RD2P54]|uniref:Transglycosylase SLT domain-containing protein n=1 Tax=Luteimonas endophytica TaxID=3042023 RepID=A0ABT6J8X8_9GAMM|nr:hypothetical protein [Luteimonas endophytica]MDH5823072.1 hypothetical protein [Luteimonas endophytica]
MHVRARHTRHPSIRHRIRALALALLLPWAAGAIAQDYAYAWDPRSGDPWVDAQLGDINDYGRRHRAPFIDELVRYRGAPRELVTELLAERGWAPGDVYFACSIAQVIGRSCRYVVGEWDRNHGEGWGALAARLGVAPGSEAFLRLKQGVVSSYQHWARPLEPDAELRKAAPAAEADGAKQPAGAG